jgi:hypothetical protein
MRARKRWSQITALTNQTVMSLHSSSEDEEVKLMRHVPSFQSSLGTILFVLITWSRCWNLLLYAKFVTVSCILWKSLVQNKVLGSNGTFVAPMSYVYQVRPVSSSQFRLSPIKYTMLTVHCTQGGDTVQVTDRNSMMAQQQQRKMVRKEKSLTSKAR